MEAVQVLSIEQAAQFWKVSAKTLRKHVNAGDVYAFRVGGKWRIPIDKNGAPIKK